MGTSNPPGFQCAAHARLLARREGGCVKELASFGWDNLKEEYETADARKCTQPDKIAFNRPSVFTVLNTLGAGFLE